MTVVSNDVKKDILTNLIEPSYKADIKNNLRLKKFFKRAGLTFETLSKLFVGIASIVSFASGIYKYESLSFLAGSTSVVSLVLLQYSSYSYRESKKITIEINDMLQKLNLETITVCTGSEPNGSENGSDAYQQGDGQTPLSPVTTTIPQVKII